MSRKEKLERLLNELSLAQLKELYADPVLRLASYQGVERGDPVYDKQFMVNLVATAATNSGQIDEVMQAAGMQIITNNAEYYGLPELSEKLKAQFEDNPEGFKTFIFLHAPYYTYKEGQAIDDNVEALVDAAYNVNGVEGHRRYLWKASQAYEYDFRLPDNEIKIYLDGRGGGRTVNLRDTSQGNVDIFTLFNKLKEESVPALKAIVFDFFEKHYDAVRKDNVPEIIARKLIDGADKSADPDELWKLNQYIERNERLTSLRRETRTHINVLLNNKSLETLKAFCEKNYPSALDRLNEEKGNTVVESPDDMNALVTHLMDITISHNAYLQTLSGHIKQFVDNSRTR